MPIYTKRLALIETTTSATTPAFTALAGVTTVIRSVDIVTNGSGPTLAIYIASTSHYLWYTGAAASLVPIHWETRQVILPGEEVEISCSNGSAWWAFTGYELS